MIEGPLAALGDEEGEQVPPGLRVVDAHVHLFPDRVFEALWDWFDAHAWEVRYRLSAPRVLEFLFERGIEAVVALTYAHKPGISEGLNAFLAEQVAPWPRAVGLGTVLPGEPGTSQIVRAAFEEHGLAGVKLHCHVQCLAADDPAIDPVYAECAAAGKPVLIHAGPSPACPGYRCDPRTLCDAGAVQRVLERHPGLTLVVPHLGADLYAEFEALLDGFPNLWLDTTMALTDFLPIAGPDTGYLARRWDRLLFGTDFPNLPFAWDRELEVVLGTDLTPEQRDAILFGNALRVFGL